MKKRTVTQKLSSWMFGNVIGTLMLFVLLLSTTLGVKAGTQSFPFPQNYKYPGCIAPTSFDPGVIQSRYLEWRTKYYVEGKLTGGALSGSTAARIKFLQPGEDGTATVSEGIAYGMLIMVYMDNSTNNTQSSFDNLWTYYKGSLDASGLMNWKMSAFTGTVVDPNAAPDADVDVAQALLMADKQWGSSGTVNYLSEAQSLIGKIWTMETKSYGGTQLLRPGDAFSDWLNPSYFITNAFNLFATVDANHAWASVSTNSYALINKCANATTGLVPDWVNSTGGLISSGTGLGDACATAANSEGIGCGKFESYFLYDAIRVPWRMAQAYAWYGDGAAKTIAGNIAAWASPKYATDPTLAVDGYRLDGSAPKLTTAGFNSKGTFNNACFTLGLGIAAMVDSKFQTYLDNAWTKGSVSEGSNGQYFTSTTQLLYLLCMTGNMPNFCNMNPAPAAAYNNATGGCNTVYVQFNKPMNATSVSNSTTGWSVTKDNANTPIPITVNSATLGSDGKTVALALAGVTDEPMIQVAYSATPTLSSSDGKTVAAFTGYSVKDNLACARPYAVTAATNIYGDTIKISFSKGMDASSFVKSNFVITVKGATVTPLLIFGDASDKTLVQFKIATGLISSSNDAITIKYTAGTLKSLDGGAPKSFTTAMNVINNYLTETCNVVESFSPLSLTWIAYNGTMLSTATDPSVASNKVGKFTKAVGKQYDACTGTLGSGSWNATMWNTTTLKPTNYLLKMRLQASVAGAVVQVRIKNSAVASDGTAATAIQSKVTVTAANTWQDVALDFSSQVPSSLKTNVLNQFEITVEPDVAVTTAESIMFDSIRFCPAPIATNFVRGYTSFDGTQLKVQFNTAMALPTNVNAFVVSTKSATKTVTSMAIDTVDKKILIFNVSTPFVSTDSIFINYAGTPTIAKGLNGIKVTPFTAAKSCVNLTGRSISNGWRDDFDVDMKVDPSDVTSNIGGDATVYTKTETITSPGTYTVVSKAPATGATVGDYNNWGPSIITQGEVWDITADPVVRFSASVPTGNTVWIRADLQDLVNSRTTDTGPYIKLTCDGAYHTYAMDFTSYLTNQYSATNAGAVDRTNIVGLNLYSLTGTAAAVSNPQKIWAGTITFDWLSIGTTTKIYGEPIEGSSVNMGIATTAKSSAIGSIFIVPGTNGSIAATPRLLKALQDSVKTGRGLQVAVTTADVAVSIPTTGLKAGYYIMYAVNSTTGEVSRKSHGINIVDATPPIITQAGSGNFAVGDPVTVTVNEDAKVFLVPLGTAAKSTDIQMANMLVPIQYVTGTVTQVVTLPATLTAGTSYVFYAIDFAGNVSTTSSSPAIKIVDITPPKLSNYTTGSVPLETGTIVATSNENGTLYVVKESDIPSVIASNVATLAVAYKAMTMSSQVSISVTSAAGFVENTNYVLYAKDASGNLAGPTAVISVSAGCKGVTSVTPSQASVTLSSGSSVDITFSVLPATATAIDPVNGVSWYYAASDGLFTINGDPTSATGLTCTIAASTVIIASSGTLSLYVTDCIGTTTQIDIPVTITPAVSCPTAISIASTTPSIQMNAKATYTATVTGGLGSNTINWSSSAPTVATVASATTTTGTVTPVKLGTSVITASLTCNSKTISGTASVTVVKTPVTSVSVTSANPLALSLNATSQIVAVALPTIATTTTLTYTSSASTIASVSPTGLITANATGTCTITVASADGPTAIIQVSVGCPTTAPTATQIPNVSTCASAPAPLVATFTSTTAKAVWYSAQTGGTALYTGNTYAHGVTTAGVSNYYVAQNDNGCESGSRLPVTLTINPNTVPTITTPTSAQAFCSTTTTASTLAATPTGGSFTIDGTAQTKINPSTLSSGSHTIVYSVSSSGCTGTASTSITIDAAPVITITPVPTLCSTDAVYTLSALPMGGTWSGNAVKASSFSPASATSGANTATYTAISGSCTVSKDVTITVNTTPAPSFSGLPTAICKGSTALTLSSYVSIANGTFKDDLGNVASGLYTPTTIGTSTVTYTVTLGGCTGTKSASVKVNDVPAITITPLGTVCSNAGKQALTATPALGTWSGSTAISGTSFDPSVVSAGSYTISYSYTDANACSSSKSTTVVVNNATVPTGKDESVQIGGTVPPLIATGSGVITWYASTTSSTVLANGGSYTPAVSTATAAVFTYYASNTVGGCESARIPVVLNVTSCTTPAPTSPSVHTLCDGQYKPTLTALGQSLKWYEADGVTPILAANDGNYYATNLSVGTHTYKVSQTLNGCEGTQATASVTIESKPAALSLVPVSVCEGSTAVALTTTGTNVTWFNSQFANLVTAPSYTPTVTTANVYTYYASQKVGNCSSDTTSVTYTIVAKPSIPVIANVSVCEGNVYQISATGTNVTWYDANGVKLSTGATLNPTISIAGSHSYSATQTIGSCTSDKGTGTLTVNALPSVKLAGSNVVCSNASPITLNGTPQNGIFTGAGVSTTGVFDPSKVTTGVNTITYSYTDNNGCSGTSSLAITVGTSANPTVKGSTCLVGASSIPAMTATGSGTINWYSSAISTTVLASSSSYVPTISTATAGVTTFYVENVTTSGCVSDRVPVTTTITNCTTAAPLVTNATICEGDAAATLQATGTGIIWYDASNAQVGTGSTFKPSDKVANVYTYYASQTTTCESPKAPATYTINSLPAVSFPAVSPLCFNEAPIVLSATPTNGVFTGTGVANGSFTPSQSVAGDNTITYSYTDGNTNCSAKATQVITVNYVAPPTVTPNPNVAQINATPSMFTATGTSVLWYSDASLLSNVSSGSTFQPAAISIASTTTYYATQTVNGCTSKASQAVLSVSSCATTVPKVTSASSCVGETVKALTATGTSLQWYSDVDLLTKVSVTTPTSYLPTIDNSKASITTFYVTQNTGCEGPAASVTYTVNSLPNVTLDIVPAVCSSITTATSLNGLPVGGTYSGAVSTGSFTPSVLGSGQHTVVYKYSNTNGCSNSASQVITINDCSAPKVQSISITPLVTVSVGLTSSVSVLQLLPSGASTSVTWQVGSSDTATVLSDGTVSGINAGTTSIIAVATDGSGVKSNKCIVTVVSSVTHVSSVAFDKTTVSIEKLQSVTLVTTVLPKNASNPAVIYTSSSDAIATVDKTGKITANAVGNATITATSVDGGLQATCQVTVTDIALKSLIFSVKTDTCSASSTLNLSSLIVLNPSNAGNVNINWSIDQTQSSLASISTSGIFKPSVPSGIVTVTAFDLNTKLSATIVVIISSNVIPATKIAITPAKATIQLNQIKTSDQLQLSAAVTPSGASQNVTWGLLNPVSGVSVSTTGLVTATNITANTIATVTATSNDGSKIVGTSVVSIVYTVIPTSVSISNAATTISQGGTLQLNGSTTPAGSTGTITWSVDPNSTSTGAKISSTGLLTAGSTAGIIKVIASVNDNNGNNYYDTVAVTVKANVVNVTGIKVNGGVSTLTVNQGETNVAKKTITVTYEPLNTDQNTVSFVSSNNNVVTVDANGILNPIAGGTATITVTSSANPLIFKIITITVVEKVKSIVLDFNKKTTSINIGDSIIMTVTVIDSTATNKTLNVSIDQPSVASISKVANTTNQYSIKGLTVGNITITAAATDLSGVTATYNLAVNKVEVTSLYFNSKISTIEVGKSATLDLKVNPTNATIQSIIWKSSDSSILKVSSLGVITGVSNGTAIITATSVDNPKVSIPQSITVTQVFLNTDSLSNVYTTGMSILGSYKIYKTPSKDCKIDLAIQKTLLSEMEKASAIVNSSTLDPSLTQAQVDQTTAELVNAINQVKCNCIITVDAPVLPESTVIIYPNPVNDELIVKGDGILSVQVINMYGKMIISTTATSIDFSQYSSGIYTVIVKSKTEVSFKTIVKQ